MWKLMYMLSLPSIFLLSISPVLSGPAVFTGQGTRRYREEKYEWWQQGWACIWGQGEKLPAASVGVTELPSAPKQQVLEGGQGVLVIAVQYPIVGQETRKN